MKKLTTTVPPLKGPMSQGLNNVYKKVKTNRENLNGRNRQSFTERRTDNKRT